MEKAIPDFCKSRNSVACGQNRQSRDYLRYFLANWLFLPYLRFLVCERQCNASSLRYITLAFLAHRSCVCQAHDTMDRFPNSFGDFHGIEGISANTFILASVALNLALLLGFWINFRRVPPAKASSSPPVRLQQTQSHLVCRHSGFHSWPACYTHNPLKDPSRCP